MSASCGKYAYFLLYPRTYLIYCFTYGIWISNTKSLKLKEEQNALTNMFLAKVIFFLFVLNHLFHHFVRMKYCMIYFTMEVTTKRKNIWWKYHPPKTDNILCMDSLEGSHSTRHKNNNLTEVIKNTSLTSSKNGMKNLTCGKDFCQTLELHLYCLLVGSQVTRHYLPCTFMPKAANGKNKILSLSLRTWLPNLQYHVRVPCG